MGSPDALASMAQTPLAVEVVSVVSSVVAQVRRVGEEPLAQGDKRGTRTARLVEAQRVPEAEIMDLDAATAIRAPEETVVTAPTVQQGAQVHSASHKVSSSMMAGDRSPGEMAPSEGVAVAAAAAEQAAEKIVLSSAVSIAERAAAAVAVEAAVKAVAPVVEAPAVVRRSASLSTIQPSKRQVYSSRVALGVMAEMAARAARVAQPVPAARA